MSRGLTSAVKTELATGNVTAIEPVYLLYLGFALLLEIRLLLFEHYVIYKW